MITFYQENGNTWHDNLEVTMAADGPLDLGQILEYKQAEIIALLEQSMLKNGWEGQQALARIGLIVRDQVFDWVQERANELQEHAA